MFKNENIIFQPGQLLYLIMSEIDVRVQARSAHAVIHSPLLVLEPILVSAHSFNNLF